MTLQKKVVLGAAGVLFVAWLIGNMSRIIGVQEGLIRMVLGGVLAALILLRFKPEDSAEFISSRFILPAGIAGALLALVGIIFGVHQFEWLGIVVLLYACLRWALPVRFSLDIFLAMFLLYWVHPIPGQVFGGMQLGMQKLSVIGAEWLLHALNVRVWGDGLVLHTGLALFGVPEACSGMRTAVTVLLCTLGVGMLIRVSPWHLVAFLFVGLAQVLVLNVIRISLVVSLAPRMSPEWASGFLHDSAGIFMLVAILLVQLEMTGWRMRHTKKKTIEEGREKGEIEPEDRASMLPKFWRVFKRRGLPVGSVLLLALFVAFAVYKRRPYHRAEMINGVLDGLIETSLPDAEKATQVALRLNPDQREVKSKRLRVLVERGKYKEALAFAQSIESGLEPDEALMEAWALFKLGRMDESIAIIDGLPEKAQDLPGVSLARAEYAAVRNEPEVVAIKIIQARGSAMAIPRIRALFPYLVGHRQWRAIVGSDNTNVPHESPITALISVYAHLRLDEIMKAARVLGQALDRWPEDPRFIDPLFSVAVERPEGDWGLRFARNLEANVHKLPPDRLASYLDYCFRLSRPDLGWIVFESLERTAPDHPALYLAPARFGGRWLTFRSHFVDVESDSPENLISLAPLYGFCKEVSICSDFWSSIPLVGELSGVERDEYRAAMLKKGIEELRAREQSGNLSTWMKTVFPMALSMNGEFEEAHRRLDDMVRDNPDMKTQVLFRHAMMYDQEGKWSESYESLKEYRAMTDRPNLTADLMMINAMMNLNLGVSALETVRRARAVYPEARELDKAEAAIWDVFGFKEQALHLLTSRGIRAASVTMIQLLYDTGRYDQAEAMSRALGRSVEVDGLRTRQLLTLRPAEAALARLWPPPPDEEMRAEWISRLEDSTAAVASPFIRALGEMEAKWIRADGAGLANISDWAAIGGTELEKAAALHRISSLLGRYRRYEEAESAIRAALDIAPASPVLWRILVALTGGDRQVVADAREACPDDPEIWLADFVTHFRESSDESAERQQVREWAAREVEAAIENDRFAVGVIVRCGDFLLRQGLVDIAGRLAKYALGNARGLLAAHVFAFRCALAEGDRNAALKAAMAGAEAAVDPAPFYKSIVSLRSGGDEDNADMVRALEYLREKFPSESYWSENLGDLYFQKHDMKRAYSILGPVIDEDISGVRVQSILMAAEAARTSGKLDQSISILEQARLMYPNRLGVLNNLVYMLALNPDTVSRAKELLPGLLDMGSERFEVLDTAAVVYMKSGDLQEANAFMEKALAVLEPDQYSTAETWLNAARLSLELGRTDEALGHLRTLRSHSDRPAWVDNEARELIRTIDSRRSGLQK